MFDICYKLLLTVSEAVCVVSPHARFCICRTASLKIILLENKRGLNALTDLEPYLFFSLYFILKCLWINESATVELKFYCSEQNV